MTVTQRTSRAIAAEAAFRARLAELGAKLLESEWLGANTPHRAVCVAGHDCAPRPNHVQSGIGICRRCGQSNHLESATSLAVAERFRATLAELGAELIEPAWLGSKASHRARCAAGHECTPRPDYVLRGGGICRTCSGLTPAVAEAAFRARLAELGAELIEGAWLGSGVPHRIRCAAGHDCVKRPADLQKGQGVCRACSRKDPAVAEAAFRARLAELGAVLLERSYRGANTPHRVICAAGHECSPRPSNLLKGQGICKACAGLDSASTEAAFRARLAELGAVLLERSYLGAQVPHRVRCSRGHITTPTPTNTARGGGICRTCSGLTPAVAEAAFRARLAELGATLLEPAWLGSQERHRAICAAGHACMPLPGSVAQGEGICRYCAGKTWDVFYVATSPIGVKFGITSGDPRPRLGNHAADGYRTVARLLTGLPGTMAPDIETAVLATLTLAGVKPVRGREYYDVGALAVVLDIVDNWPRPRATASRGKVSE